MALMPVLDPNTPVLVGVGVAMDRTDDPLVCDEAHRLMSRASEAALADAGGQLRSRISAVAAMSSTAGYRDPAALVARDLGLDDSVVRLRADPGTLQQQVIQWATDRVVSGESDAVLVVGGEARWRDLRARIGGVELANTTEPDDAAPDVSFEVDPAILSPAEHAVRLYDAVDHYALMEDALARRRSITMDQERDAISQLWSRFSSVAVENPDAWNRDARSADAIRNAAADNRMTAWPYTKWLNTQWNVNQGAALVLCTAAVAEAAGVARDQWVFLRGSAISNFVQPVSARADISRAPWVAHTTSAALAAAGATIDEMNLLELYSCFPAAVQIQADELGVNLTDRLPTITGGMTFAGGPFNSWVLHATVAMAQQLRGGEEQLGLVTAVSGMITKFGAGVWSNQPGSSPASEITNDVTAQAATEPVPEADESQREAGTATVVATTVSHDRSGPTRAVALADTENGRVLATSTEPAAMESIMEGAPLRHITLTPEGFTL